MAVQSIKSVITGIVATFLGGILFVWFFGLGPFAEPGPIEDLDNGESFTDTDKKKQSFSFHSPEIKFYEADVDGTLKDQRIYHDTFLSAEARFIFWELLIKHKELTEDSDIHLLVIYRGPGGSEKARLNYEATSLAGWSSSAYTWGWGQSEPGSWLPGEHVLELYYQGNMLASRPFHIQ